MELSHFQLPVRYDAHGPGPLSEKMYERPSRLLKFTLTGTVSLTTQQDSVPSQHSGFAPSSIETDEPPESIFTTT